MTALQLASAQYWAILFFLRDKLPEAASLLEIASGLGQPEGLTTERLVRLVRIGAVESVLGRFCLSKPLRDACADRPLTRDEYRAFLAVLEALAPTLEERWGH